MKANRKCPVLPLLLTGIVAVFSLYGCSATRGVEKVSCHIEYDTAVMAEELHPNIDSLCPSAYQCICDTEKKLDYIIYWRDGSCVMSSTGVKASPKFTGMRI